MNRSIRIILAAALSAAMLTSCGKDIDGLVISDEGTGKSTAATTATAEVTTTEATTTTTPPPPEDAEVSFTVAGDNLIHSTIYLQAAARANYSGYNFDYAYQHVEDLFDADINILNQETPMCSIYKPSTYPMFNTPTELGDKMIALGINAFSISNNHILDMGAKGLSSYLDYWDTKQGITVYGAYRNQADMDNIRTLEINGITFAFVAFTQYTNGLSLPAGTELTYVDFTKNKPEMQRQIQKAAEISDAVIVSMHWGYEDTHTIEPARRTLAKEVVDWGADVIVGTHPHTMQSMEYLDAVDGRKAFVFYSLGNFISAQTDNFNLLGLVGDFTVRKNLTTNKISVEEVKAIPVITHYGASVSNITVYPYNKYSPELADAHGVKTAPTGNYHRFGMDYINETIEANVPEEFRCLE